MCLSLAAHAALIGAVLLTPGWTLHRPRVVMAELVPLAETTPPKPVETPLPVQREKRTSTPPKPIETPLPKLDAAPTAREEEPPQPVVVAPVPVSGPSVSVVDAGPPSLTGTLPAAPAYRAEPPASTFPAPPRATGGSMLAATTGGVTQHAIPSGGYQIRPSYPSSARRMGIQGTTLLQVLVTADGRVGDVIVKESAGHADMDQAAADAVRRWRFEPARRGAEPVAMWVLLPIEFRLR
jgi:protein TonB